MAEEIVKVTELPEAEALTDEDTLLLIRQKDEGQECYQIKGKQFNVSFNAETGCLEIG